MYKCYNGIVYSDIYIIYVVWLTPWGVNTLGLREGLTKAENTMATLLRTGIIGLKDWLYWVGPSR